MFLEEDGLDLPMSSDRDWRGENALWGTVGNRISGVNAKKALKYPNLPSVLVLFRIFAPRAKDIKAKKL